MVYTGPKSVPETVRLSDLYEGTGDVDLRVHVIRRTGTGDILDQYVRFCEIADENRKKYGITGKAVEETLRQCREEGVLMPFLASREKEVRDIMVTLFDEERIREIHDYNVAKEAEEKGMEKGIRAMVSTLKEIAIAPAAIAQALVKQFGLSQDAAEQKVQQYWS